MPVTCPTPPLPADAQAASAVRQVVRASVRLPAGARVAVAMSGGVDSSVVAGLLVEAGYQVFGLTARLYDVDPTAERRSGTCCAPDDARDARAVAQHLGIRHYVLDEREAFQHAVIDPFVRGWDAGETPNPCVECNRTLKFGHLVARALALGAEVLATGHYACLDLDDEGQPALRRGADTAKDQAYFLYPLTPDAAPLLRFPLGSLTKPEVRAHAARLGLPVAAKAESMDICFVGAAGARAFVEKSVGPRPGALIDASGTRLGQHAGLAGYTVGQRHGLGLPPQRPDAPPRFVIDKHSDGTVVVGSAQQLQVRTLTLEACTWVSGTPPLPGREVLVQVRHRGKAVSAQVIRATDRKLELNVTGELQAAARGQAGVVLLGDRVLGGGTIAGASADGPGSPEVPLPRTSPWPT